MRKTYLPLVLCWAMATAPVVALQAEGPPQPPRPNWAVRFGSSCMAAISNTPKALKKLGAGLLTFPVPLLPALRTLKDPNKRFFVFLESPLISLPVYPIAAAITRGVATLVTGVPFWDGMFRQIGEAYLSYQGTNLIRNGITLDSALSLKAKWLLNYLYSVMVYSLLTAGDKIPEAFKMITAETMPPDQVAQGAYAAALVTYAGLWPLLSQFVHTRFITPYMAFSFPMKDLLDKIQDEKKYPTESLLAELQAKFESIEDTGGVEYKRTKSEYYWAKWRRLGLDAGDPLPFRMSKILDEPRKRLSNAAYWGLKVAINGAIALAMLTLYYGARFLLVGTGAEHPSVLEYPFSAGFDNDLNLSLPAPGVVEVPIGQELHE